MKTICNLIIDMITSIFYFSYWLSNQGTLGVIASLVFWCVLAEIWFVIFDFLTIPLDGCLTGRKPDRSKFITEPVGILTWLYLHFKNKKKL